MDWKKAKADYVTNPDATYRSIGEKYGVGLHQVANHSRAEGWRDLREQHLEKVYKKTLDKIADDRAAKAVRVRDVATLLLDKLEEAARAVSADTILTDVRLMKGLTGALKDIKDVLDLRSDMDMAEQEARIDKLRKDAEAAEKANEGSEIVVRVEDGGAGYAE